MRCYCGKKSETFIVIPPLEPYKEMKKWCLKHLVEVFKGVKNK